MYKMGNQCVGSSSVSIRLDGREDQKLKLINYLILLHKKRAKSPGTCRKECHLQHMGVATELLSVGGMLEMYFVLSWALGLKKETG